VGRGGEGRDKENQKSGNEEYSFAVLFSFFVFCLPDGENEKK
jgi:hypothetical protein